MLSGCHPNKISVTMNRSRPLLFVLDFLAGLTFGQTADRPSDPAPAEYTFRFVAGDGMFYTPCNGNGEELGRLLACIAQHKVAMYDGKLPVRADGYCTSQPSEAENLAMAKTCPNRVKTEMALRDGVAEACFIAKNHVAIGSHTDLASIDLPASLASLGAWTFSNSGIQILTCRVTILPNAEGDGEAFYKDFSSSEIRVPAGSVEDYKATYG